MDIVREITAVKGKFANVCVALGTFDGVHIGHREIISQAVAKAKEINGTSVVLTFTNHPLSVIDATRCPLQLVTLEEKARILENLGVDVLLAIPFTAELLKLSAQDFITLLVENLKPSHVMVGPNYSFGYRSSGDPDYLKSAGEKFAFKVLVHHGVRIDNQIVSSTLIRRLIAEGKINDAARFLGRTIRIKGEVVHGEKRGGRMLGYPTANLKVEPQLAVPKNGVYVTRVLLNGASYESVTNIGINPTFSGNVKTVETHLLDFNADLYEQVLELEFCKRIRSEQRFASAEELKRQIKEDVEFARKFFLQK